MAMPHMPRHAWRCPSPSERTKERIRNSPSEPTRLPSERIQIDIVHSVPFFGWSRIRIVLDTYFSILYRSASLRSVRRTSLDRTLDSRDVIRANTERF